MTLIPFGTAEGLQAYRGEVEMNFRTATYLAAILLAGIGAALGSIVYPENGNVILVAGQVLLAILTFPLGFLASAGGAYGIFSGLVTPTEALVFATPLHAILGYVQWCRVVPAFYRSRS